MKLAFSTNGSTAEDDINPRFGRCNNFVIIEDSLDNVSVISNGGAMASGGAGIQAAQTLINSKVDAIVTGNVGPNAYSTLSSAGIKIFTGANGKISQAFENYKEGKYGETSGPTAKSHSGM